MNLDTVLAVAVGYTFSIVLGHVFTSRIVETLHKALDWPESWHLGSWPAAIVGMLERAIYTTSWVLGQPSFIAVWLAVKIAGRWKGWEQDQELFKSTLTGRTVYNVFLIGTAISIGYGVIGGLITKWGSEGAWSAAAAVAIGSVVASVILWWWISRHTSRKSESPSSISG